MLFHQRFVPGLAVNSYLVGDERTGFATVLDPTRDVDEFITYAQDNALHIQHILETHVHADFVSGSRELKARLDNEPVIHCSGLGGQDWTPPYADHVVKDGDTITMGQVRLEAVHTPGHTPEHVGDVGRPDLLGEEARKTLASQLYRSVFERLPNVPDITEIFPGHGAGSLCGKAIASRRSSTVGYERQFNAALVNKPEDQWVHDLLAEMPLAPPYFLRMKRVNRDGPALLGPEFPGQRRWKAKQVYERVCEHCLIVDVRSKEAFAAAHIPNAINIPFGPNLSTWAGWVLPYDHPTLIILDDPASMPEVTTHLLRVGLDDVRGYLEGGMDAWEVGGLPLATLSTSSVHDLAARLKNASKPTVLDVRTEREWKAGHIDEAIHIHGGMLQERFAEVPKGKPVAVICGSGYRASIASSFLKREGYQSLSNVVGGMSAWKAAGLPTTTN